MGAASLHLNRRCSRCQRDAVEVENLVQELRDGGSEDGMPAARRSGSCLASIEA